jgi:hypothetical protein
VSHCLRPVIEKWGEPHTYSIAHDEIVNLLCEVAARADAGETRQHEYGDLTVVVIENGDRFLAFLAEGQQSLYKAKEEGRDNLDLTEDEIGVVDQMATMAPAWRQSIDPEDGFLRIYVD